MIIQVTGPSVANGEDDAGRTRDGAEEERRVNTTLSNHTRIEREYYATRDRGGMKLRSGRGILDY